MVADPATSVPWGSEPGAGGALALLLVFYAIGLVRSARSGVNPGRGRVILFGVGWLMLFVALVSPLHPLGERLLSAHMAQHTLLILAPLALVSARTGTRLLQALAPTWRGKLVRQLQNWRPGWFTWGASLALMVGTILVWHLPPVFERAIEISLLHMLEHVSLVTVSTLYWTQIVGPAAGRPHRLGPALASVFVLFVAGSLTGALLTFSTVSWYPAYAARSGPGGAWLVDQQMAGVLMSVPIGTVLMGVAACLAWRWSGSLSLRNASHKATRVSAATVPNRSAR